MDKNSVIWFGTEADGIFSYYGSKLTKYYPGNSDIPTGRISSIAVDSSNNIWVGTQKSQIIKFEVLKNKWTVYKIDALPFRDRIQQIRVDKKSDIWASCGIRLLHFDGSSWDTLYLEADATAPVFPQEITNFIFNKFGNIWVECNGSTGLYKYTRNPETGVAFEDNSKSINIYPNPTKETLTVKIEDNLFVDEYQIIDLAGKVVRQSTKIDNNPFLIDVDELAKGNYIIELLSKNKQTVRKKFLKE